MKNTIWLSPSLAAGAIAARLVVFSKGVHSAAGLRTHPGLAPGKHRYKECRHLFKNAPKSK
jgi:hypothetical protein